MNITQEELAKAKILKSGQARAREGDIDESLGVEKLCVGDQCEISREPQKKDLSGWRGPAVITSIGDPLAKEGEVPGHLVKVEWQGDTVVVNWDQVRPWVPEILWPSSPELSQTFLMRIIRKIDDDYDL